MADGTFPSKISATRADNAAGNPIYITLVDAAGDQIAISAAGAVTVEATQLDIDDLTSANDEVALGDGTNQADFVVINSAYGATPTAFPIAGKYQAAPTTYDDGDAVPFLVDENGRIQADIISGGGGTEYTEDAAAPATATGKAILVERDDALAGITPVEGDWSTLFCDANGALWVAVNGSVVVTATNLDIRDLTHVSDSVKVGDGTDFLAVNTDGSINVNIVSSTIGGEVHAEEEEVDVASDTTSNHDYTVTGSTTLLLKSVLIAGSGSFKGVISAGPLAGLVEYATVFSTGREGDTKQVFFDPPIEVPDTSTGTVRVALTNRQGAAVSIYSTIIGQEV